jgi:hypothetical protein
MNSNSVMTAPGGRPISANRSFNRCVLASRQPACATSDEFVAILLGVDKGAESFDSPDMKPGPSVRRCLWERALEQAAAHARSKAGRESLFSHRAMLAKCFNGLGALGNGSNGGSVRPRQPHSAPKAKRIIHLWMNGAPSQFDTFDPKPALHKFAGTRSESTRSIRASIGAAWIALGVLILSVRTALSASPDQLEFFEQRIRPTLANECYECHGAKKQKGGLRLDFRDGLLKGGDSGPALVLGDARKSLFIQSIRHEAPESRMPKDRPQLPDAVIADFVTWVNQGAVDPRDQPPNASTATSAASAGWAATLEARKDWWSFKQVQKSAVPRVKNTAWSEHPIDRFLLAKMEARGLQPSPAASRESLLRRVTFALTGLPPTANEIDDFLRDASPDAYEKRVDQLLASPRFGERWARHWMDLVRYCESHGSQGDPELPMAWRYRDYLIRAFNGDVPYDQFVREHIAGDLLANPRLNRTDGLNESMLGPAHLRMVEFGYIPVDALDDQVKVVDNQIDVFSKAFLGITVSCARCHDHKFDPISQKDFYALYGVFASSRPGQVVVDDLALRRTNRVELAELKKEIRAGLGDAWGAAAETLGTELLELAARTAEKERVTAGVQRLSQEIAEVEFRARAELARQQGAVLSNQLPPPLAQWSFEKDLRDACGAMHGRAEGDAVVRGGRLVLNGTNAWVVTEPLPVNLGEKTLEVWVALEPLDQRGGGALTVQTPDSENFDSIVFGEREAARWIAGSDFFRRTQDVGGVAETAKPGELIHIAVVYGTNNSITLYRNGIPYGKSYQQGTLQPFAAGNARVLLGKRHLAAGVTALAGEIEEARLYSRALTSEQVSASFQAGAIRVDEETLAKSLTQAELEKRSALRQELDQLRATQARQLDSTNTTEAWNAPLADAAKNNASPLHPWVKLSGLTGSAFREGWRELATFWKDELAGRREFNRTNFTHGWDLRDEEARHWFMAGAAPGQGAGDGAGSPVQAGEFCVEIQGDRVLRGLYPAGVFNHALTRKQSGVFTSPRFKVPSDSISVRALGGRAMARLVVENYAIGGGGLYPAVNLDADEMKWLRLDTAYRKGAHAYLEFVTADDSPNSGSAEGGRAYFGAAEVVFHHGSQPPTELLVPASVLLAGDAPGSVAELAQLYGRSLMAAVRHWREGKLSDEELAFLDFFVRRDLLPASLPRLPQLKESVATYRQLEAEIPVPRRAPGVHEAVAFDQPLFVRGQITQPGEVVPRRFLEMFDDRPFGTSLSGRLELAGKVASPANPLTARVMVNRLWHHLFGRGLVGTVDNFGRLGDKPTHPELLDYLASRFVEHGWSIKQTIRFLVTSRAFQQSAMASHDARRIDPGNELLSHARVRRLEAEAIRDAVLMASGQLDLKMYGPGVNVYYVAKTEGGGPKGPLDGERRRSVYQRIRRNAANPFLEAFDAPKPMSTRGKRDATNVPAQALTLLNDPFVIDQSAKWAKALVKDGRDCDERVRAMFVQALGRAATAEELAGSRLFLDELAAEHPIPPGDLNLNERVWQDFAQSLFCLKEFIYVD